MKRLLLFICCSVSLFALDINKASLTEFESLKGIGKSKAANIIEYRNSIGCFKEINELKNVKGIGSSILEKNKELLEITKCEE